MTKKMDQYRKTWQERKQQSEEKRAEKYHTARNTARKCSKLLKRKYNVRKVYIIGSLVAKQRFDLHSDIDLVVSDLNNDDYITAYGDCRELCPPDLDLDLIPIEAANSSVKQKVAGQGKSL